MPKRKREHHGVQERDTVQRLELKRSEVEKKIVHGKKLLNRALKTAKNFERRKLARRLKLARDGKDEVEITKLQREYGILKVSAQDHVSVREELTWANGRVSNYQMQSIHICTRIFSNRRE
jgi:hypothetical protein